MPVTLRWRKQRQEGRLYAYLDIFHDGVRKKESLKRWIYEKPTLAQRRFNTSITRECERARLDREEELDYMSNGLKPAHSNKTFGEYFSEFAESKTGSTKVAYRSALKWLKRSPASKVKLSSLNGHWMRQLTEHISQMSGSENTKLTYLSAYRACLNKGFRDEVIPLKVTMYSQLISKPKPKPFCLSIEQIEALKKTICKDPEVKRAFLFNLYFGQRIGDLLELDYSDVSIRSGAVWVEILEQQKTGASVRVPILNPFAVKMLGTGEGKIFKVKRDPKSSKALKEWFESAGIQRPKGKLWHIARSTFASYNSLDAASRMLGHSNTNITQSTYRAIFDDKLKDSVASLPY